MSFPFSFFIIRFENVLYHGGSNRLRRPITKNKIKKEKRKRKRKKRWEGMIQMGNKVFFLFLSPVSA